MSGQPNYENPVVIIGAGPAGLTAAYQVTEHGERPIVFEKDVCVGGISRTGSYKSFRYDIGGHRFFTKIDMVDRLWREIGKDEFIKVRRLSRIYYRGKFFQYPLRFFDSLIKLGALNALLVIVSYIASRLKPYKQENTFEEWTSNRFGKRLYRMFFKTYTEKVWGIPASSIRADWAAQRIQGLSLPVAVMNSIFGRSKKVKTLIEEFDYLPHGPGRMWELFHKEIVKRGGKVQLNSDIVSINCSEQRVESLTIRRGGALSIVPGRHFISTMPLSELIAKMNPPVPAHVSAAASCLTYRDFLLVLLIVDKPDLFPDNWIYIHDPQVHVGRIQNYKNWSRSMVPDQSQTSLGMEYFCTKGDSLWSMTDDALIELAKRELAQLGLAEPSLVKDGIVIRQEKAYPVYTMEINQHIEVIKEYLRGIVNLQTIGRNGLHKYNNQDHSMITAMLAVENLFHEQHDVWSVNTERSYHERVVVDQPQ